MSTAAIHVQGKRKRPINGDPHPTSLRINEDSHVFKKPSFSSRNKTRMPKRYPLITYPPPPMVIHTNTRDFKTLVQRLTGLSQPDEAAKNEEMLAKLDDRHCVVSSSSFNPLIPIQERYSYLTSHDPCWADMRPLSMPNAKDLPLLPLSLPLYTYADTMPFSPLPNMGNALPSYAYADPMSFSSLPNMGSSISPIMDEFVINIKR